LVQLPWGMRPAGDFLWGLGTAVSMVLVGLISPFLGAMADGTARKKRFTGLFTLLCIVPTLLMVTVGRGEVFWGLLLFVLANIGFQGGLVFYNAFLPQISPPGRMGYVSGMGFAIGYVGALVSLALTLPFAARATTSGDPTALTPAFAVSALFFLLFAIPFFRWVRERPPLVHLAEGAWREGWARVRDTLTHLRDYRQTGRFLLAYFLYSDGINTVISYGGIYASVTLGFDLSQVILFFALIQFAAFPGAWFFGLLTDRWGARRTIEATLALWVVMCVGAFLAQGPWSFYLVGLLAGVAMGSSQAASRSLMAELTPVDREAEFYGFYGLSGKFSAVLGPLTFGIISTATGSQRWAVLSVTIFFLTGWALLRRVDVTAGRQAVKDRRARTPVPGGSL
jgi:UMF1 family MFS transporter